MITFALYNLKGGVGKTTSCVNLAYLAAQEGHKTLVWDLDPQSASTFYLKSENNSNGQVLHALESTKQFPDLVRATPYHNLFLINGSIDNRHMEFHLDGMKKSRARIKKAVSTVKKQFDYVFIDCPPTISLLAENVFKSVNYVLLPLLPSPLSERSYHQVYRFFEAHGHDTRKIVPFFTLVDRRRNMHKETIAAFRESKRKLMRSFIPQSAILERMGVQQAPVHTFSPYSKSSMSYRNLWQELKMMRKLKKLRE